MARRAKSVGSCGKVHEAFPATSPDSRCRSCSKAARSCRLEMRSATDVPFARSGEKRASEGDAPGRPVDLDPTHPGLGCLAPERYRRPAPGARAPTALCPLELPLPGSDHTWDRPPPLPSAPTLAAAPCMELDPVASSAVLTQVRWGQNSGWSCPWMPRLLPTCPVSAFLVPSCSLLWASLHPWGALHLLRHTPFRAYLLGGPLILPPGGLGSQAPSMIM